MYEAYGNAVVTYQGVKIYKAREVIVGSDCRQLSTGQMVDRKPDYEYAYKYAGSYPHTTLQGCIDSIDNVKKACIKNDVPIDKAWINLMNEE